MGQGDTSTLSIILSLWLFGRHDTVPNAPSKISTSCVHPARGGSGNGRGVPYRAADRRPVGRRVVLFRLHAVFAARVPAAPLI